MARFSLQFRFWLLAGGLGGLALVGCRKQAPSASVALAAGPVFAPIAPTVAQEPLPLGLRTQEERDAGAVDYLKKRVWGRRVSLRDVKRVAGDIYPLIREAAQQPAVTPFLEQFAQDTGQTRDQAREAWIRLQEADLLLEAGGDPEDVSPAGAVGVAQWMPGTARDQGIRLDLPASKRLTAQIDDLNWRIAWLAYLARPDADPNTPGRPALTPADTSQVSALQAQREQLRALRRKLDPRYDPRPAIFAHTRYLLRLYPKFPSMDWVFQAYHGGEGGVKKTLRLYLGQKPNSPAEAIRAGRNGERLTYQDVYFTLSPHSHYPAFFYIFGRGDDHRHYWWKLKSSERALALYHRDPVVFEQEWTALLPGRRTEALWYPDAPAHAIADLNALQAAVNKGMVPVTSSVAMMVRPAPFDTANSHAHAVLQPIAKGALLLATSAYKQAGGKTPLTVGDLTLTPEDDARQRAAHPPKPSFMPVYPPDPDAKTLPGGGPPADFNYHTTGLACDILQPVSFADRRVLAYALDYLEERQIIAVTEAKDYDEPRYHIVPNPRYADALTKIAQTEQVPTMADL